MTYTLEDYICRLHTDSWYSWTDSSNKIYANLILAPKMMNVAGDLIDNPHSLPSEADCTAGVAALQATWDGNNYQRTRADAYPSIGDQLDMIYHNGDGGATFQAAIKAVKDATPKP
jgi:hypothetical protein